MKPLTQEENEAVLGSKLRTCQRLLLSAAENDPTMLTYDPWQTAFENVARMVTEHKERVLASGMKSISNEVKPN